MKTHLDGWNKYPVVYCQFFAGSAVGIPSVNCISKYTANNARGCPAFPLPQLVILGGTTRCGGDTAEEPMGKRRYRPQSGGWEREVSLRSEITETTLCSQGRNKMYRDDQSQCLWWLQFPTSLDSLGCWIYRRLIFKRPLFISLWSTDEHWGLIYHFPSHSFIHDSGWHFERLHDYNPHPVSIFKPII